MTNDIAKVRFIVAEFMPLGKRGTLARDPRPLRLKGDDFRQRRQALADGDFTYFVEDKYTKLAPRGIFARDYPNRGMTWDYHYAHSQDAQNGYIKVFDWDGHWVRLSMSDRWTRILAALELGRDAGTGGYLIMPAHDALYSRDLLLKLVAFSRQHAQNGLPAAVSPFTFYKHSPIADADIPADIIDLVNAAFNRDPAFRLQLERGAAQGYWGKMGLIPFEMCGDLLKTVDTRIWEDDLELDRAITALGYAARTLWIDDPAQYRQALFVVDEAGVRHIIERHLHYSLRTGGSALTQPLTDMARYWRIINPHLGAASVWAERIIDEEYAKMMQRVAQYGASWVDWGDYRYVARPYDPHVEVWSNSANAWE